MQNRGRTVPNTCPTHISVIDCVIEILSHSSQLLQIRFVATHFQVLLSSAKVLLGTYLRIPLAIDLIKHLRMTGLLFVRTLEMFALYWIHFNETNSPESN